MGLPKLSHLLLGAVALAAVFSLAGVVVLADGSLKDVAESPYSIWAPWIGGYWSADVPSGKAGESIHKVRAYRWCDEMKGVRVEGWNYQGGRRVARVSGLIAYDRDRDSFRMLAVVSDGFTEQSVIHRERRALVSEITQETEIGSFPDGTKTFKGKGRMELLGPDAAKFELFRYSQGGLEKVLELRPVRSQALTVR